MYATIVSRKVRAVFASMGRGDFDPLVDGLADDFTYRFAGDGALSGTRRTRDAMQQWCARLAELFPDARFEVEDVVVHGPPWRTRVATHVRVRAQVAGEPYDNEFMQHMTLRWGRVAEVVTLEDTARLQAVLDRLAGSGVEAAAAAPITS